MKRWHFCASTALAITLAVCAVNPASAEPNTPVPEPDPLPTVTEPGGSDGMTPAVTPPEAPDAGQSGGAEEPAPQSGDEPDGAQSGVVTHGTEMSGARTPTVTPPPSTAQEPVIVDVEVSDPTDDDSGVTLPETEGVTWILGGRTVTAGSHPYATPKQRKRLTVSAVSSDPKHYRIVGRSSWVITHDPQIDPNEQARNSFSWEPRQQIGQGWSGRAFSAGDFDQNGTQDLFRISPQGQLILYRTFGDARFDVPTAFGYGWDSFVLVASGADFNGDGRVDILGSDRTDRLYLYRGDGRGGFVGGRTAFGYGWETFSNLTLAPASHGRGARLIATHRSGQMFVYQADGKGGFLGGRTALGFGWDSVRDIHAQSDWNHDGVSDLLVVARDGSLRFYAGNASGLWGGFTKVGQGWTSQRQITLIHAPAANALWSIDQSNRLWRYVNTQDGYHPPSPFDRHLGYAVTGVRLKDSFRYPLSPNKMIDTVWPVDSQGAPIVQVPGLAGGQPIFHPVAYARFAVDSAENSILTSDATVRAKYLRQAIAAGNAILSKSITNGDELWLPYTFPYAALHDGENTLPNPWFSSMSQGLALAAFVRLEQLTGDPKWRAAADLVLATYYARPGDRYWFAAPDQEGSLWLEEYPGSAIPTKVVNGHLFSIEGLEYYWLHTHAEAVNDIVDGAATAASIGFSDYRVPGRPSSYCASLYCWRKSVSPENYHRIVISQLRDLAGSTGDPGFAKLAGILQSDRP